MIIIFSCLSLIDLRDGTGFDPETDDFSKLLTFPEIIAILPDYNNFLGKNILAKGLLHFIAGLTVVCPDNERNTEKLALSTLKYVCALANSYVKKEFKEWNLPSLPKFVAPFTNLNDKCQSYKKDEDILIIGDGDLTFGRALARVFGDSKQGLTNKNKKCIRFMGHML
eukprot:UN27947